MAARALLRTFSLTRHVAVRSYSTPVARATSPRKLAANASTAATSKQEPQDTVTDTTTATTAEQLAPTPEAAPSFPENFDDPPPGLPTDWSRSYHGLSTQAFAKDIVEVLLAPLDPLDIEIKPGTCSPVSLYLSVVEWTPSFAKMAFCTFPKSNTDAFSIRLSVQADGALHPAVRLT